MREEPRRVAAITGDVTVDWMFLQQRAEGATLDFAWQWGGAVTSGMEAHPGGTAFAGALVEQAVAASPDLREVLTVAAAKLPARALFTPLFKGVTKTFSVWSPFPARRGSKELVWRMASYLGRGSFEWSGQPTNRRPTKQVAVRSSPELGCRSGLPADP